MVVVYVVLVTVNCCICHVYSVAHIHLGANSFEIVLGWTVLLFSCWKVCASLYHSQVLNLLCLVPTVGGPMCGVRRAGSLRL